MKERGLIDDNDIKRNVGIYYKRNATEKHSTYLPENILKTGIISATFNIVLCMLVFTSDSGRQSGEEDLIYFWAYA